MQSMRLVAAITKMPAAAACAVTETPSISFKNVDKTRASTDDDDDEPPPCCARFNTRLSSSSKNRMQGAACRANAKARRTSASASPTYAEYTSALESDSSGK